MPNPAQMAGGGQIPQQAPQQPQMANQTQIAPGQTQVGGNVQQILKALGVVIQQSVDQQGYVDMSKLVTLWPQIAQQMGINIPFQTVMQLIQQNPSLLEDLVTKYGLAGIIMNGQRISAEQMAGQATGASGAMPGVPPQGGR